MVDNFDALKQTFSSIYYGTMHWRAGVNIGIVSLFPIKETHVLKDLAYCGETSMSQVSKQIMFVSNV